MLTFKDNAKFTFQYENFSKFPSVYKDISVVVDKTTPTEKMEECIKGTSKLAEDVFLLDVYEGKGIEDGQVSRTFRVLFTASDRTLTDEETNSVLADMISNLEKRLRSCLKVVYGWR